MEAVARLFLVRPPRVLAPRSGEAFRDELPVDGTLDFAIDGVSLAQGLATMERLAKRNPAAWVGSASERSRRLLRALAERCGAAHEIESELRPRFLGSWQAAAPSSLGPAWGTFLSDRRLGAPRDAETLEATEARVLAVLDRLASRFAGREVVVVLHADGIRAALARALSATDSNVFAPEASQAIALDWAHPGATQIKHAVVGIGFDWDVAAASNRVHRFPGGASVLPRPS